MQSSEGSICKTGLPQDAIKISNTQSTLIPKESRGKKKPKAS